MKRQGRLFHKYALFIMALVCGVQLVSGAISIGSAYQDSKLALWRLQQEKAISAANRIEGFIRDIEKQLSFAALPQLGSAGSEQRRIEFLKLLRQMPAITDVAQLDAQGKELLLISRLTMDVAGSGRDRSDDPAFKAAKPGQSYFGKVYFRKETEPYMTISMRSGPTVIIADVNLKFIWDVVSRIKIGEHGKAYVVDANGYLIADPDIGLVLKKTSLSGLSHIQSALTRRDVEPALLANDLEGKRVLAAFAPIEATGWTMLVEQPAEEIYATLNAAIARTGILLLIGLVISALASLWFARRMSRPIAVLQEGAQRIGAGDLELQIVVNTNDELEALATQFNRMTAQLRDSYAGLERKVAERTAELTEALEQQTAMSSILQAIANSPTDAQPVLDAIARCAAQACHADGASIYLRDGDMLRHAASTESSEVARSYPSLPINTVTMSGHAFLAHTTVHVEDVQSGQHDYPSSTELAQQRGNRTMLVTPLLRENDAYGTIVLRRDQANPFSDGEIALLKTFANQAVIALGNVRLFDEIESANLELKQTLSMLQATQTQLVQSEKMAALGGLVAGVAHEINTPVGVGVTAASSLRNSAVRLSTLFKDGKMMKADLEDFLDVSEQSTQMILANLNRASNLIHSFKQVAVDQTSEATRQFNVRHYLDEIMTSLGPKLKQTQLRHTVRCPDDIVIDSYPGAMSQIVTNLVMNALTHAYAPGQAGTVEIDVERHGNRLRFDFRDDGKGIEPDIVGKIFDPFFTTKRGQGGSGLGLNIVYNLVTQTLKGHISCQSEPGKGTLFRIELPLAGSAM